VKKHLKDSMDFVQNKYTFCAEQKCHFGTRVPRLQQADRPAMHKKSAPCNTMHGFITAKADAAIMFGAENIL